MKAEFWLNKWELGEIAFHQESINESLQEHWPSVRAPAGGAVFVPLCGKSLDMRWLAEQGHQVVGLEVSPLACDAFFEGLEARPVIEEAGAFRCYSAGPYRILQGDFFTATAPDLGEVAAFYDRAALVAMPPDLQPKYMCKLTSLLPPGAVGLINSLEYPPEVMEGPPFSINETRLRELLGPRCRISRLADREINTEGTSLEQKGLVGLAETAYRVQIGG
ncbi:MAG: thiopurine S-methyltransferase [Gammaproteobacteria bacterium]|nr:thiopurine S-methyltransferase [Gammaproteobacteria bacterium]